MKTRDELKAALERAGIEEAETFVALAATSVRLVAERVEPDALPVGASRLGGAPDVPADFAWPRRGERPLSFLAQIDLVAAQAPGLPQAGWLLFFYDAVEQPWGYDPKHAGGWAVRFVEPGVTLVRSKARGRFDAASVSFGHRLDLPHPLDSLVRPRVETWDPSRRAAYAALPDVHLEPGWDHRLRGHPGLVVADVRAECQLAANGIYAGNAAGYESPEARALLPAAPATWTLLLQLDSDEAPDFMWQDTGRLFFMIRHGDLAERRFDRTWLVLHPDHPDLSPG